MSRQSILDNYEVANIVVAYLSGTKKAALARNFHVHVDTITRAIKGRQSTIDRFKFEDDHFRLKDGGGVLRLEGDFIVGGLQVTGNVDDGVLIADTIWDVNVIDDYAEGEIEENVKDCLGDWTFDEFDIGCVTKPFKIGKVFYRNQNYQEKPDEIQAEFLDETYEGTNQWMWDGITTRQFFPEEVAAPVIQNVEAKVITQDPTPIWNASNRFVSITVGRETTNATDAHPNFKACVEALIAGEFTKAIELINVEKAVTRYVQGNITIEDGQLFYKGYELKTGLTRRILAAMEEGRDFKFFLPFLENLMLNPSDVAVNRLFDFLTANDIEILADGTFVCWKKVRDDFFDIYTGCTFDNSPGKTPTMPRNMVDSDDEQTCSNGLHVCSYSYLKHYGSEVGCRIMKVRVHPKDVVAIPRDYQNSKMRVSEYFVIEEFKGK